MATVKLTGPDYRKFWEEIPPDKRAGLPTPGFAHNPASAQKPGLLHKKAWG